MSAHSSKKYAIKQPGTGVYLMNIEGEKTILNHPLESRDALGVWETDEIEILATETGRILLIEVPMQF